MRVKYFDTHGQVLLTLVSTVDFFDYLHHHDSEENLDDTLLRLNEAGVAAQNHIENNQNDNVACQ